MSHATFKKCITVIMMLKKWIASLMFTAFQCWYEPKLFIVFAKVFEQHGIGWNLGAGDGGRVGHENQLKYSVSRASSVKI
jgi:hypothetical protein